MVEGHTVNFLPKTPGTPMMEVAARGHRWYTRGLSETGSTRSPDGDGGTRDLGTWRGRRGPSGPNPAASRAHVGDEQVKQLADLRLDRAIDDPVVAIGHDTAAVDALAQRRKLVQRARRSPLSSRASASLSMFSMAFRLPAAGDLIAASGMPAMTSSIQSTS